MTVESEPAPMSAPQSATAAFAPFSLYIQAVNCTDYTLGPRYVRLIVDRPFIEKVSRRNAFCEVENLAECRENFSPHGWDESPTGGNRAGSCNVDHWQLVVDADEFFFVGKNGGGAITESRLVSTAGLRRWLHGAPNDAQTPEDIERDGESCYRMVGSILVHAEEEMNGFVEMLRLFCPEFAAVSLEVEMAERIESCKSSADAVPAPRRSRHV